MIFEEQISRKPNLYPWTEQFIESMHNGFWTDKEFSFKSDVQQFKTKLSDQEREIIIPDKYLDLLELNLGLPIVKIETIRNNKTFIADKVKIFEEEKKIQQNIETQNVDIIDLSKNNFSNENVLKKITIFYGDFIFKNSALDLVSLLKKEIKNINPIILQVNKKYRVKVATISDISEFDIFFKKIVNTKFENYNITLE